MKKFLLGFLVFQLITFAASAQLQKGNKILGGTINYSTSTTTSDNSGAAGGQTNKTNNFNVSPSLGFFVTDRTVVGLMFDINSYSNESSGLTGLSFRNNSNQFGFGPFVRRYFSLKEWVAFYGQAELGFSNQKTELTYPSFPNQNSELTTKAINLSTSLGLAFFPTNWMSVDLSINPLTFTHQITRQKEVSPNTIEGNTNTFNFNLTSNSFQLGAHFFFNMK